MIEKPIPFTPTSVRIVETSGPPTFGRTRAFYARRGYVEEARVRNDKADEDKIVFYKVVAKRAAG